MLAPAFSIILAYSTVLLTSGKIRNLAVTGIERFLWSVLTAWASDSEQEERSEDQYVQWTVDLEKRTAHSY